MQPPCPNSYGAERNPTLPAARRRGHAPAGFTMQQPNIGWRSPAGCHERPGPRASGASRAGRPPGSCEDTVANPLSPGGARRAGFMRPIWRGTRAPLGRFPANHPGKYFAADRSLTAGQAPPRRVRRRQLEPNSSPGIVAMSWRSPGSRTTFRWSPSSKQHHSSGNVPTRQVRSPGVPSNVPSRGCGRRTAGFNRSHRERSPAVPSRPPWCDGGRARMRALLR